MEFKLTTKEISSLLECKTPSFPKYTTQLLNVANQNSHGTRKNVVGQLSDLFLEFDNDCDEATVKAWEKWYCQQKPSAVDDATEKIYTHIQKLSQALERINKKMVKKWVKDLVISKTFSGLYIQKAILTHVAQMRNATFTPSNGAEESQNIDGYIDGVPYSVKPVTFAEMKNLPVNIKPSIIYYAKIKGGIRVRLDEQMDNDASK